MDVLKCQRCKQTFPSRYWFEDEGRNGKEICIECAKITAEMADTLLASECQGSEPATASLGKTLDTQTALAGERQPDGSTRMLQADDDNTCGFCHEAVADDPKHFVSVSMYRDVRRSSMLLGTGTVHRANFTSTTVKVPRCALCASKHTKRIFAPIFGVVLGASLYVYFAVPALATARDGSTVFPILFLGVLSLVVGGYLGAFAGARLFRTNGVSEAKSNHRVTALVRQGWSVGVPTPHESDRDAVLNLK